VYYADEDLNYNIDAFLRACRLNKGKKNNCYSFLVEDLESGSSTNPASGSSEDVRLIDLAKVIDPV
jgi:hypothetical protein